MKKIIVATDFSDQAATALDQAMNIATRSDAELLLVHVLDENMRDHYDEIRERLDDVRQACEQAKIAVASRVVIGYADTGIASTAKDVAADLVAVGTHGRSGVDRFMMGSVAERVVRLCQTSVMIARTRSKGKDGYNHVLVPTDFSATAEKAFVRAQRLVADGGVIELLHAWQLPGAVTGYWGPSADRGAVLDPLRRELREATELQLRDLIARHDGNHKVIATELEDSASHCIRKRLESDSYDLVVMGSHGRRGFRRWMLGSVAETTARYAPCSVIVVHAQPAHED